MGRRDVGGKVGQAERSSGRKVRRRKNRQTNRGVWSEETEWWFWFRGEMLKAGAVEEAAEANKQLKKSKRRYTRRDVLESVAGELDVRDKWLGIRWMKKQFSPQSYCRKMSKAGIYRGKTSGGLRSVSGRENMEWTRAGPAGARHLA